MLLRGHADITAADVQSKHVLKPTTHIHTHTDVGLGLHHSGAGAGQAAAAATN